VKSNLRVTANIEETPVIFGIPWLWIMALLICFTARGAKAQSNLVRIAVVPFAAPEGNRDLQIMADAFPDVLTSVLSRDNRFTLVERDKISAVWSEFHLTDAGLVSAETVAKLGHTLSCDWLVSGLFVRGETNCDVWVKIIDTQNSVVLDLKAVPYNATNLAATASAIGNFLAATRSGSSPHEFVALEEFQDRSVSATREDVAPRVTAMIESNLLASGYGILERGNVSPIFSEYQLQSAGMTADDSKRVKLKPVFWTIGGHWKWYFDTQNKLSVTLEIRRMGSDAQMTNFAGLPGAALDNAILKGLQAVLKTGGSLTGDQALAGEIKLRQSIANDQREGRDDTAPSRRFLTNAAPTTVTVTNAGGTYSVMTVNPERAAAWQSHYRQTVNTMHQQILLNPNDKKTKFNLAQMLYYDGTNSDDAKMGDDLLKEVIASKDPIYAKRAQYWWNDIHSGKISYRRTVLGTPTMVMQGDTESFRSTQSPEQMAKLQAEAAKFYAPTNIAVWAEKKMEFGQKPESVNLLKEPSAFFVRGNLDNGTLFVAVGTNLATFNWNESSGSSFDDGFQEYKLPFKLENPITAITGDASTLWLGTGGGGLIKVSQGNGAPTIFNEKDGFPMDSISSLAMDHGKLLIGFGRGMKGAFGYLDLATSKFTGLMSPDIAAGGDDTFPPPPPRTSVNQIRSSDGGTNWWIGCFQALYRFKSISQEWSLEIPRHEQREFPQTAGLETLSVGGDFAATILTRGGVGICKISEKRWFHLNLSTNIFENNVDAVAIDPENPKYLWIGGYGRISIVDMSTQKIVGQYQMDSKARVPLIIICLGDVFFVAQYPTTDSDMFYHWKKPQYP
jgi:TolB-like protein